mmetsp:Transcript_17771/g.28768  ORF Transcript_17771/g.28768 Transcript_17771/m.28768 type:complete len:208 (+) Transcript_17771:762-1385(+)
MIHFFYTRATLMRTVSGCAPAKGNATGLSSLWMEGTERSEITVQCPAEHAPTPPPRQPTPPHQKSVKTTLNTLIMEKHHGAVTGSRRALRHGAVRMQAASMVSRRYMITVASRATCVTLTSPRPRRPLHARTYLAITSRVISTAANGSRKISIGVTASPWLERTAARPVDYATHPHSLRPFGANVQMTRIGCSRRQKTSTPSSRVHG